MKAQQDQLLYLFNMAVLFAHEIDSAYWQEWELFGLPGGIQLFVILNLALMLFFLVGYGHLSVIWPGGYCRPNDCHPKRA